MADPGLAARLDALAGTVGRVGEDTRAIRGMLTGHGDELAGHGELLGEILRRLPAERGAGSGGQDRAG